MKIATWNIRGFGSETKKGMIKRIIRDEKLDILGLVETKHEEVTQWDLKRCWGNQNIEWSYVSARQYSGGLILSWNQDAFIQSNSFAMSRWLCVVGEIQEGKIKCAFCLVYAPNNQQERLMVWNQLRTIKEGMVIPWVVMGDFNEVLYPHERRGAEVITQGMRDFQDFTLDLQLIDIDIGQQYTWLRRNAASKIDRIFIDKELLELFPFIKAYCKERMFSDHFPIILSTAQLKWGPTPFRALECWLEEPSFLKTFNAEWLQLSEFPLEKKLKLIKRPLKEWNRKIFGHIEGHISKFRQALLKLEEEAQRRPLGLDEWSRMDALRSQLWLWMNRQERYWRQLSRCKIIREGDRNTKYFHLKATMRRQRNCIDKLMINGEEVTDVNEIKREIIGYFKDLYSKQQGTTFDISQLGFNQLSQAEHDRLERAVTREEIVEAIASCDPSKAPGYDGFNLKCIKKMWPVIEEDFCSYILRFFESGKLHASFNTTWVTLIPKKKGLLEVSDFRPISLVGSIYKVIAKVLSRRIKAVLPSLIGEAQTAFVSGRQVLDGALVANEVVQWLKKRKKPGVLLKMDFQKAYDSVDWEALDQVMAVMGFGCKWRRWIQGCISSASISILINGSPTKPFKMERGLRQGDPLSPFLFVLMAEVLHRMLLKAVNLGLIRGLLVGKDRIQLSHLQFADDTLIFCEAEEQYLQSIKELFLSFQSFSGLCVNYSKSGLLVLGKDEEWSLRMEQLMECRRIQLPFTYLGIPLGANTRKAASWQHVLDKVQQRLKSWKSSSLSKAGRLVMIKSVLNSLPIYYLSLFKVPRKVADDIVRIQRRFLWNGDKVGRCIPLVKWEMVIRQKNDGGLGIGDLATKNAGLLLKWWWRYGKEEDQLWKKIVKSIYQEDNGLIPSSSGPKCSGPWQAIKTLVKTQQPSTMKILKYLRLKLGNGERIKFWEDPWLEEGLLKDLFPQLYAISSQQNTKIASMGWYEGQKWTWILAWKRELSQEELQQEGDLYTLMQQHQPELERVDNILWDGSQNYTVRAFQKAFNRGNDCDRVICKAWMKLAPPKVEFFLWLALLGKLNTKEMLWKKGILQANQLSCSLCAVHTELESLDHLLVHCPISWNIWQEIAAELGQVIAHPATFRRHFEQWLSRKWRNTIMKKVWCATFFAVAWSIWLMRNEVIFQQKAVNVEILCNLVKWRVSFWTRAWKADLPYKEEEIARNFSSLPVLFS